LLECAPNMYFGKKITRTVYFSSYWLYIQIYFQMRLLKKYDLNCMLGVTLYIRRHIDLKLQILYIPRHIWNLRMCPLHKLRCVPDLFKDVCESSWMCASYMLGVSLIFNETSVNILIYLRMFVCPPERVRWSRLII